MGLWGLEIVEYIQSPLEQCESVTGTGICEIK